MTQSQHDAGVRKYQKAIKRWEKIRDSKTNTGMVVGLVCSIIAFILGIVFAIVLPEVPAIVLGTLLITFSVPGIVGFSVWIAICNGQRANAPEKIAFYQKKIEEIDKKFFGYVDVKVVEKENENIGMLEKYKKLLDEGVITKEEFEKKKKELL